MMKTPIVSSTSVFGASALALALTLGSTANADRGGWADPPGGWEFVEEWQEIPEFENDDKWDHNNGSDAYSGNANTEIFQDFEVFIREGELVGDVVSVQTIEGEGDTEDGSTPAADASAMRLIDLGDPRDFTGGDPSDRKIFFLGALGEPGAFDDDPFIDGITFAARYRIFPIVPDPDIGAGLDLVQLALDPDGDGVPNGDGTLRFIPEASDRSHVGVGYVDPAFPEQNMLVGTGYYSEGTLSILVNDQEGDDGDENVPVLEGIDTTAFHSIWVSAQADPNDPDLINVRAFGDGSTTPVEVTLVRGPNAVDRPNPEDLQDNPEWAGLTELAFNIGSAGTPAAGGFEYDWMVATTAGAFDPESAGGGTEVHNWEILD